MSQDEIAAMFRKTELQRREARRKVTLNLSALANEELDEAGKKAHEAAVKSIKAAQLRYEKETSSGYWRRLWRALLNK